MPIHDWTRLNHGAFHDFHVAWIAALRSALNRGLLPSEYDALAEQRSAGTLPDWLTRRRSKASAQTTTSPPAKARATGAVVALEDAPPQVALVTDLDADSYVHLQRTLVFRHVTDDRIVALLEIVSPGNKSSLHAFDQFLQKILSALDQGIHVLIVDLHPPTRRDPQGLHAVIGEMYGAPPFAFDPRRPLTLASYLAGAERRAFVQPVGVGEALTSMPLFLDNGYYVPVPLEATYRDAWEGMPQHLQTQLAG